MVIGDANGAILAYDALCVNHNLDETTSLYGEGNFIVFFGFQQKRLLTVGKIMFMIEKKPFGVPETRVDEGRSVKAIYRFEISIDDNKSDINANVRFVFVCFTQIYLVY